MNTLFCPTCSGPLALDELSATPLPAACHHCGTPIRPSIPDAQPDVGAIDLSVSPGGCEVRDLGSEIEVVAATNSWRGALNTGGFALFWNGLVLIFVLVALSASLHLAGVSVPSWVPTPHQRRGGPMTLGSVLFLWLFLVPFIAIGLGAIGVFLLALFGRCEVIVRRGQGCVATAIGPVRWQTPFDAKAVGAVRIGRTRWQQNGRTLPLIEIEADRPVRFGWLLPDERRLWMYAVLTRALTGSDREKRPWLS